MGDFINFLGNNLADFWTYTGFANATGGHVVMLLIGLFFIYLAIAKEFEPMLLIPIGFGILIGNIPFNMDTAIRPDSTPKTSIITTMLTTMHSFSYKKKHGNGTISYNPYSYVMPSLYMMGAEFFHRLRSWSLCHTPYNLIK